MEIGSQGSVQSRIMAHLSARRHPETQEATPPQYAEWVSLFLWGRDLRLLVPEVLLNKCPALTLCCVKSSGCFQFFCWPSFAYTNNCFESTCLSNFKGSLRLQIGPQYFFTWPMKLLWLQGHWGRWVTVSSTHLSSPPRAPTEGTFKLCMERLGDTIAQASDWGAAVLARRDLRTVSGNVHLLFLLFEKMKSTKGRGLIQNAPEVKLKR